MPISDPEVELELTRPSGCKYMVAERPFRAWQPQTEYLAIHARCCMRLNCNPVTPWFKTHVSISLVGRHICHLCVISSTIERQLKFHIFL